MVTAKSTGAKGKTAKKASGKTNILTVLLGYGTRLFSKTSKTTSGKANSTKASSKEVTKAKTTNDRTVAKKTETEVAKGVKKSVPAVKKGGYIKFGSYYQENGSEKTPIEWKVLDKKENEVLLISRYALDCGQFHDDFEEITWEKCDLRKWLNGEFLKTVFTAAEQQKIVLTKLLNEKNPEFDIPGGKSTEDKIFCLSLDEAERFFQSDSSRKCKPSKYALDREKHKNGEPSDINWWWLRTPGCDMYGAMVVEHSGKLDLDGVQNYMNIFIRPALWMSL